MSDPTFTSSHAEQSIGGKRLDASTRMSASFSLNIDTTRAEHDLGTVENALARIRQLSGVSRSGGAINRTSSAGTSGVRYPSKSASSKRDNSSMQVLVARAEKRVEQKAEVAMADAMEFGAQMVQIAVETAVTGWGAWRFSRGQGRSAGRDDTGAMIDAVEWNATRTFSNTNLLWKKSVVAAGQKRALVTGWFGWDQPKVYQVAQEKCFKHARGSAGLDSSGYQKATSRYVRDTNTDLYVEGAMSLGRTMVVVRAFLIRQLRRM